MGESLVGWVTHIIDSYGYAGIVALTFLENLILPLPSALILMLVGFLVSHNDLEFVSALLAATLGSLLGSLLLYTLSRWGGRALLLRYHAVLRVKESDLDRADEWFDRHGEALVLFGRLVPFARSLVSIPAGLSQMPLWRFTLLSAIGSIGWNSLLIVAGWLLGENWLWATHMVGSVSNAVLIVGAAIVAEVLVIRWWRRRRTR